MYSCGEIYCFRLYPIYMPVPYGFRDVIIAFDFHGYLFSGSTSQSLNDLLFSVMNDILNCFALTRCSQITLTDVSQHQFLPESFPQ